MSVVGFARWRFTPADVQRFVSFASVKIERGLWRPLVRETGERSDQLLVFSNQVEEALLSFRRDEHGRYGLWWYDRAGWHLIRSGGCADECLGALENMP